MAKPRPLPADALRTLSKLGSPTQILMNPSKRDERLVALGLARRLAEGEQALCITPEGLRYLAWAMETGALAGAAQIVANHQAAQR